MKKTMALQNKNGLRAESNTSVTSQNAVGSLRKIQGKPAWVGIVCFWMLLVLSLISCLVSSKWTHFDNDITMPEHAKGMVIDEHNNLWVIEDDGRLYYYDALAQDWSVKLMTAEYGLSGILRTLRFDSKNESLWLTSESGLGYYEISSGQLTIYNEAQGLIDSDVRAILIEQSGKVWVGTGSHGVFVSEDRGETWHHVLIEQGFSEFSVHTIFQDSRGHVWVAGNALYRYEPELNSWSTFNDRGARFNSISGEWQDPEPATVVLEDDFVFAIAEDSNGNLWFGTLSRGLMVYKYQLGQWQNFTTADGLIADNVTALAIDDKDNLWVGTNAGVSFYEPVKSEWLSFDDENGFTDQTVKSIVIDSIDRVWFATSGRGVFMYDPEG